MKIRNEGEKKDESHGFLCIHIQYIHIAANLRPLYRYIYKPMNGMDEWLKGQYQCTQGANMALPK